MNSKISLAAKWGLLGAVVMIIFTLIMYIANVPYDSKLRWVGFIVIIVVAILGSMEYRDKFMNGYATFGQIFGFVMLLVVVYGLVVSLFSVINITFIDKNMVDKILLENEIKFEEQGMDDAQIDMAMTWTKKMMTPMWMFLMGLISMLFSGVLIGLPAAAILSRKKTTEDFLTEDIDNGGRE